MYEVCITIYNTSDRTGAEFKGIEHKTVSGILTDCLSRSYSFFELMESFMNELCVVTEPYPRGGGRRLGRVTRESTMSGDGTCTS